MRALIESKTRGSKPEGLASAERRKLDLAIQPGTGVAP
jgi:hypothetical protein